MVQNNRIFNSVKKLMTKQQHATAEMPSCITSTQSSPVYERGNR